MPRHLRAVVAPLDRSDDALLRRYQCLRDREALHALLDRYQPALARDIAQRARRLGLGLQAARDAQDLSVDVLLEAADDYGLSHPRRCPFRAFVWHVTLKRLLDARRRQRQAPRLLLLGDPAEFAALAEGFDEEGLGWPGRAAPDPSAPLLGEELRGCVAETLHEAGPLAEDVWPHVQERRPLDEIARSCGRSRSTIIRHCRVIVLRLRDVLRRCGWGEG
jgi:hypothetical protein